MILSSVDLPQPDGPSSVRSSPSRTLRLTPSTAAVRPKARLTPISSNTVVGESLGNHLLDEDVRRSVADQAVDPWPGCLVVGLVGDEVSRELLRNLPGGQKIDARRTAPGLLEFVDLHLVAHQ